MSGDGRHSRTYSVIWVPIARKQLNVDVPSYLRSDVNDFVDGPLAKDPHKGVMLGARFHYWHAIKCCKRSCRIVYEINDELYEVVIMGVEMLKDR